MSFIRSVSIPFTFCLLFVLFSTDSQSQDREINPYVPGEVIVKLSEKSNITLKKSGDIILSADKELQDVLSRYKVKGVTRLFPDFEHSKHKSIKVLGGEEILIPDLSRIHLIKLEDVRLTQELVRELNYLDNIEYAEPNYIYYAEAEPDDELYGDQWYIPACKIDKVWAQAGNTSSQIIGILDTGVDYEHPDLKDNCLPGKDFINGDNDPQDDNGHGTHVAGIAAAKGNNGIGICGVNPNAKILPVKVLQSSGRGDAARISQGIRWAADNGATVINMSFGSYARSQTMEAALAYAYSKAVLVAAAGNNGFPINLAPFYPAAYQYVLGVKANSENGKLASFSNSDPDGPVASGYDELLNYEITAPGIGIVSTFPNGQYKHLQGTSMSAPIIAGALSLYKDIIQESQEMMWARITGANGTNVFDLEKTLGYTPKSHLQVAKYTLVDTLKGDGDYRADAGEEIEFNIKVRNAGGNSKTVWMKLQLAENEDQTVAVINNALVNLGALGAYGSRQNFDNPFQVKISNNIKHNRDIVFEALVWEEGSADTVKKKLIVNCEKGREISGVISEDQTWTKDNLYLIVGYTRVEEGITLTIEPGTHVLGGLNASLIIKGRMSAIGTSTEMIYFDCDILNPIFSILGDNLINDSNIVVSYCYFKNIQFNGNHIDNSIFDNSRCMAKIQSKVNHFNLNGENLFFDSDHFNIKYNNYCNSRKSAKYHHLLINTNYYAGVSSYFSFNNFVIYKYKNIIELSTEGCNIDSINLKNNYWGTTNRSKILEMFIDGRGIYSFPIVDFEPFLTQPSDSAHGIVWKVLIDGKYPEAGNIDAFGEGKHTFEVYFNRTMDTTVTPMLSFGVREPFTQQVVNNNGVWSSDGKIWTANYSFDKYTGDGINYIRVADAQDDEYFEIPIEDSRFSFVIDAAGSASTIFVAKDGKGRGVELKWQEEADRKAVGYNIYRFENLTDTTYTDTIRVNKKVVTDLDYVDGQVEGYKRYYYMYTSISEDFKESGFSKVASAVPSDVNSVEETAIKNFSILSIYPNPVTDAGKIEAEIYQPGYYRIDIVDVFGHKVYTSANYLNFGRNIIDFRMNNVSNGMYFIRIGTENYSKTEKFMYIR